MTLRRIGCLTITAALALLLGACVATPIPLPFNDTGPKTYQDGFVMPDAGSADAPNMDLVGGQPDAPMPGPDTGVAGPDGWGGDAEAGVTEGGPGEGGVTEGGPGEGGVTEGGPGEGGLPDLASVD